MVMVMVTFIVMVMMVMFLLVGQLVIQLVGRLKVENDRNLGHGSAGAPWAAHNGTG